MLLKKANDPQTYISFLIIAAFLRIVHHATAVSIIMIMTMTWESVIASVLRQKENKALCMGLGKSSAGELPTTFTSADAVGAARVEAMKGAIAIARR